ncbi:Transmembrane channel-like protein 3 [Branchiostoma belcheri]|nr:Transmembrane channel-like protein 3 [Branchiostoma belcheri]
MPVLYGLGMNVRTLDHKYPGQEAMSARACRRENLEYLRRKFGNDDNVRDDDDFLIPTDDEDATEEQILINIERQKEIISSIRKQPWRMKKKIRCLRYLVHTHILPNILLATFFSL